MKQTAENVPCGMDTVRSVPLAPAQAQRPVLIVFDLDGTIADSQELARISFKRVFALMGSGEISDELADSFNGPDADEVCRVMGIGPDRRPLYNRLLDETDVELVRSAGRMFPGTAQMLAALAPHAVLSILTNGTGSYCDANIAAFAIAPYISLHSGHVSGVTKAQRIAMWERELGAPETGLISTVENYDGVSRSESVMTTPEAPTLHEHILHAKQKGIRYMTMEVSSQALKYRRVRELQF